MMSESKPSRFTCSYCNLDTHNWGDILEHGCFTNSSAVVLDEENRVYLQDDQSEGDESTEYTQTVEMQFFENDLNHELNNEEKVVNGWSREAVSLLLAKYNENKDCLKKKNGIKKHIWQRIASEMKSHGFEFSWDQLQNKWKCLVRTYKKIKEHNSRTGENRRNWQYFNEMDTLQSINLAVEPPVIAHNGKRIKSDVSEGPSSSNSPIASFFHHANTPEKHADAGSVELSETTRTYKRKREIDTNELLYLALEESKKQHREDLEEKRKFNNLLEMLINITKNQNSK